ncbi:MAG: T9SS type A sorting domain-containing protein [Bacteroidota bacterium]
MMTKLVLAVLAFLATLPTAHAQKEANHWLWGDSTRMDFTGGSPVTSFKSHQLGWGNANAVISDKETGKLLFYTDGSVVRDSTGNIMPNGRNLLADEAKVKQSASKGTVILPDPGNKNRYYIICTVFSGTTPAPYTVITGLYYSIVDMTLNGGKGDVVVKHTPLLPNYIADFITAARDCDGKNFWIMVHYQFDHKFIAFKLTADGFSGQIYTAYLFDRPEYKTQYSNHKMIFSPSGRRLVMSNPFKETLSAVVEMFDFNQFSGKLENDMRIDIQPIDTLSTFKGELVAFSPDNAKLYIGTQRYTNTASNEVYIFQYDLTSGDKDTILASRKIISTFKGNLQDMQLAPDGKIYMVGGSEIFAIEKPNLDGTACTFSFKSNLKGESSGFPANFPNFPNFYFNEKPFQSCVKPTAGFKAHAPICEGSHANFIDESENEPDYRKWEFPGGMPSVFIGKNPPPIYYAKAGTYTVRLITKNVFGSNLLELKQIVYPLPHIITSASVELCLGDTTQLSAQGGKYYRWSPGVGLSDSTIANPLAWTRETRKYTLTVTDSNGCVASKDVVINVRQVTAGANVITCVGGSAQLQASGGVTYKWTSEFGATDEISNPTIANPIVKPKTTARYIVIATHESGCTTSDTVLVTVTDDFKAIAGADVSICEGDFTQLSASGGSIYEWSPRIGLSDYTLSNPLANPKETTQYIVTVATADGLCIDTDTVIVNVFKKPIADAGRDQTICTGSGAQLQGSGGVSFKWISAKNISDSLIANPVVNPNVTTDYVLKVTNENSCVAYDTIRVTVLDKFTVDAGDSLKTCRDESVQLQVQTDVSGGILQYEWFPKDGTLSDYLSQNPIAKPFKTTTYTVRVTREENGGMCYGEDSVTVVILEKPVITAERDEITICTGDTAQLSVSGGVKYRWSPGEGLSDTEISNPLAFPLKTTDYTVETENEWGCKAFKNIRVIVLEKENITFSLKTNSSPVKVGEVQNLICTFTSDQEGIHEFAITMRCQPNLLKINPQSIAKTFGFTNDWEISCVEISAGEYRIEAKNTGAGFLKSGEFHINSDVYLAKVLDSTIHLEINSVNNQPVAENTCFVAKANNAEIHVDNVCGGDMRLISLSEKEFALRQNIPNPAGSETMIEYSIGLECNVSLVLYNSMGEIVQVLKEGIHPPGAYLLKIPTSELASGIYYYRLMSGPFTQTHAMIIAK